MGKLKHTLLLLGGFLGFLIAMSVSLAAGDGIDQVLLNSAIGCLAAGVLSKWLINMFFESFTVSRNKATKEAAAAASAAESKRAPSRPSPAISTAANNVIRNTKR
jgi:hypothetical protein